MRTRSFFFYPSRHLRSPYSRIMARNGGIYTADVSLSGRNSGQFAFAIERTGVALQTKQLSRRVHGRRRRGVMATDVHDIESLPSSRTTSFLSLVRTIVHRLASRNGIVRLRSRKTPNVIALGNRVLFPTCVAMTGTAKCPAYVMAQSKKSVFCIR